MIAEDAVQMGNLLLVLSHADTAVKATLCRTDTLKTLFSAVEYAPETLQLTALKAIKYLTTDPSMLEALQVQHLSGTGLTSASRSQGSEQLWSGSDSCIEMPQGG